MAIMLGNLTATQIEKRLGVDFPEQIKKFMEQTHQSDATNIAKGKWHCFDIPFNLVCGDMETAEKIYNSVKQRSSECKEVLQFSISK